MRVVKEEEKNLPEEKKSTEEAKGSRPPRMKVKKVFYFRSARIEGTEEEH